MINTILLNPLPVARPAELLTVQTTVSKGSRGRRSRRSRSHTPIWSTCSSTTASSAASPSYTTPQILTWLNGDAPERLFGELVTANYFDTLGLRPVKGRFFLPEEDRTLSTHAVVVLGLRRLAAASFGGAPDIVGRTISINRVMFTVIGIAPEGFQAYRRRLRP